MPVRKRRGFSLIETLMSFFILAAAIIVTFSVVSQIMKGTSLSESHLQAATLGHGLLSQQRSLGFAQLTPGSATVTSTGSRDGQSYVLSMLYNVSIESLDADTKRVTATVTWQEATGAKREVLQTVVTRL